MLYDLRDKIKQLHIVTNMSYIPWDLLYYKQENVFLSDLFGIGLSARPKSFEDSADEIKKYLHSAKRSDSGTRTAVHFYCGYQQETVDPLPEIGSAVHQISEELLRSFDADSIINIGVEDSYQIPNTLREHENTVELIIFSGHFERNGYVYEVDGEKRHFGFDEMPKEIVFLRRPIVILGGAAQRSPRAPPMAHASQQMIGHCGAITKGRSTLCITRSSNVEPVHA